MCVCVKKTCVGLCNHNNDQTVLLNMAWQLRIFLLKMYNNFVFCYTHPHEYLFSFVPLTERLIWSCLTQNSC